MKYFLACWLVLLAAWTLVIKFIFPLLYDWSYAEPLGAHIYWDFWWVVHLWLAWQLLHGKRHTRQIALLICVLEISIILIKFSWFFAAPEWSIWKTNWLINKVFVLACFSVVFVWLARGKNLQV